jgi:hypothetical protein
MSDIPGGGEQTNKRSLVGVTFVYFAGGLVVQKFYFKREGLALIPNSQFWLVLPGLVKVLSVLCVWPVVFVS